MAQIPARFQDQPELVTQVIEARQVQMDTEDTAFAIEWLTQSSGMSLAAATRALVLQRRFLNALDFCTEITSRKPRPQSCQAHRQVAMKGCSGSLSAEASL